MYKRYTNTSGFTIVELLIVIVVIAILAAISIVAYTGIQQKARVSSVSAALAQANRKLALYFTENTGQYPADLTSIGVNDTSGVTYEYSYNNSVNPATYCVTATTGSTSYKASSTANTPVSGGCAGHSQGGVAAITNATTNPSLETNNSTWQGWGGTSGTFAFSRPTTGGHTGTAFHRATWSVAGTGGGVAYSFPAVAGKTYTTSMWVRSSKATNIYCNWQNGGATSQNFSLTANTWTRINCTGTVPAGQSSVQVNAYGYNTAANDTLDGDDAMATEGNTLYAYADGTSTDWAWTGAINNSTSTGPPQ